VSGRLRIVLMHRHVVRLRAQLTIDASDPFLRYTQEMPGGRWPTPKTRRDLIDQLVLFAVVACFGVMLIALAHAPQGQPWPRAFGGGVIVAMGAASMWAIRAHSRWQRGLRRGSPAGPKTVRGVYFVLVLQILLSIGFVVLLVAWNQPAWKYVFCIIVVADAVPYAIRNARISLHRLRYPESE
jgi:hypothetical protein